MLRCIRPLVRMKRFFYCLTILVLSLQTRNFLSLACTINNQWFYRLNNRVLIKLLAVTMISNPENIRINVGAATDEKANIKQSAALLVDILKK